MDKGNMIRIHSGESGDVSGRHGPPDITTPEKRRRHHEALRDGKKMPRLKQKRVINLDAELSDDNFTHAFL
jgi:hypothetical protein